MQVSRRAVVLGSAASAAMLRAGGTLAQAFPSRAMTMIVPFPAGGPADFFARHLGKGMGERLGQTIVIESRSGAAGVTGIDFVAKAQPDGLTMGLSSSSALSIMPHLMTNMPFEPERDLARLTLVVRIQEMLVVHPGLGVSTMKELVAKAKAEPGKIAYGSAGTGGITHLAGELLAREAGIDILHVPYRGAAPAVLDLLAGRIQMAILDMPILIAHVRSGALKGLAITSATRAPLLPDVPTSAEAGYPTVLSDNWYGLVVPAATPASAQEKLRAAAVETARSKEVIEAYAAQGGIAGGNTREEFEAFIRAERAKWGTIAKAANVKIE